ncbi:NRDE family protein [Fulvivirga maritima]|uniref:NRDE family protein n=1 Tax=Fulvivirga maritima TaxID=2904247 RepID=UPI001F1B778D|nr:NRDE family protein [Fulvivirga maritima]UII29287.1 NRDE family protein [Fulvivirga maritima]
MCLILLAYKKHEKYPLIVAANRDEFYARKTESAHFWSDNPQVLAGRDLEAGGTWMGVNKNGRLAMITNYRDLRNIKDNAPSRGHLVSDFLSGNEDAKGYLEKVEAKGQQYNGFNLICGDVNGLYYYGNYQQGVHKIDAGIHGLSNALLNTPWPKVERGKQKLADQIKKGNLLPHELIETLHDDVKPPDTSLPDTGVGVEMERMLSPMFIKSPDYGSRCSTVIMVEDNGVINFFERSYLAEGKSDVEVKV